MEAQQQQYENQYQYQTQNNPTNSTSQSYDSSTQIQSYDPQSYYASYPQHYATQQPYQNNLDYSSSTTYDASTSYYYPGYSTSYQSPDPNLIHPPGVPVSVDPQQTQVSNSQNLYYQSPQSQGYLQPGQPVYGGGGNQGGRSIRGRGRGTFSRHGRGRGGGRGKHVTPQTSVPTATNIEAAHSMASPSVQGQAAPSKPQPQMAWCELCRVDCNTHEILEKHKNGKKHLRNLKVFEELQNTSKPITVMNQQVSMTQRKPEESALMVNKAESTQGSDMADKTVPSVAQPSDEAVRRDSSGGRGGLKRKMKGGRGGKWIRTHDGSKRFVELPKPKQMVPILCELCNVKCESPVVYESHVAGKKHLSTLKRYQGHKEAFGEAVEALYPTIPNLPSTPIIPQAHIHQQVPQDVQAHLHQQVPQDVQALASMMLGQQNLPDPQAAQAALAQLLNQHGIHDAQTLIVQLIPYLLTQFQVPGSVPASVSGSVPLPVPGLGTSAPYLQSQEPLISTEAEGQNDGNKTEQQTLAGNGGSEAGAGTSVKSNDGPTEAGKVGAE